jgi:DeoR family transcriptional regulator, suf operon transcriptional repressor
VSDPTHPVKERAPSASPDLTSEPVELAPSEIAATGVALEALSPARRAVLDAMKLAGETSAEDLARRVGVTVAAVRQHLAALDEAGLIAHRDERPGPGRPRRRYCLAPAAEAFWPKRYGQLAVQLLDAGEEAHPGLVDEMFAVRRVDRTRRAVERLGRRGFDARVRELATILDEDGYLAACEQLGRGHWRIVEHNCAILDVAQRFGVACRTELAFLRDALPDADVVRVEHMISGGHVCAYDVRRRA